jgi:NAD(P)-dependent dehydrogenase (short-subunit alcohol dehydrogenase family)
MYATSAYTAAQSAADNLAGRRALVTGGTRGMGAAIAAALTARRARVVVAARADPGGGSAPVITADLAQLDGPESVARRALGCSAASTFSSIVPVPPSCAPEARSR